MHDILAKPAAIATCGLFNMKRRAKEALSAQGSIEWVVIVVCIAVALIAALVYLSNQMNRDCGGNPGPFRVRRLAPNPSDTASGFCSPGRFSA